jgi:hypothetical protein
LLAAALALSFAAVLGLRRGRTGASADTDYGLRITDYGLRITDYSLPLLFTLFSLGNVIGVGKVGAYANYFLEFYAGLVWLIAATLQAEQGAMKLPSFSFIVQRSALSVLLLASLLYYPPLWDANRLRPAGLLEPSPPRLAFGSYSLWADLTRESELLAAQRRIHERLLAEVQAAGSPLFTDMPGLAAAAGVTSRITVFEQRQLYDQGEWDQRPLLVELANGRLPLVVLDYLGNWLTPEMVSLITHRYAQDGSLGTYDVYRPVEPGPRQPTDLRFSNGLQLNAMHMAPPTASASAYEPGQLLVLGLEWLADGQTEDRRPETVTQPVTISVALLPEGSERPVALSELPLLYGAFPPSDWPADAAVQHMQTLQLPTELPTGRYRLALSLRTADGQRAAPQPLASITVAGQGGRWFDETSYFVPVPLLAALEEQGGVARFGLPLTPAVPFGWGLLQCFERACLEWRNNAFALRPLGELLYMAETRRNDTCLALDRAVPISNVQSPIANVPCPSFAAFWQSSPELARLGPPISGEVPRNGLVVQWTRYLRLERNPATGDVFLGRLGADYLRLPPGIRYRWP